MEDLGFNSDEINDIFRIISAILKLGNLNFVPTTNMDGTEGCTISNDYGKMRTYFFKAKNNPRNIGSKIKVRIDLVFFSLLFSPFQMIFFM